MALPFYNWSRTAASNATADSTVNWSEGQAPSSVNDSGRAMMASTAAFRDDISGAITTGGTSTAYTVSSYQVFDTLAHMNGAMIAFTPHATNGATVTLNVDGLGAKPLRSSPSVELLAGTLILGTPYVATYNNSDSAWYLQGFVGNPYNIPLGGLMPYIGSTAPNSSFVFPYGQTVSRTTYSALYAMVTTTFGSGDGSTTFGLPDLRGRVLAGVDNMGGSAASRLTSASSMGTGTLGQSGGAETQTLSLAQLPTGITSDNTGSIALSVTSTVSNIDLGSGNFTAPSNPGSTLGVNGTGSVTSTGTIAIGNADVTSNNTSGSAHPNVQPTTCVNFILRII